MHKFGTKNALFRYFWCKTLKNYCHLWNEHPQICLIASFRQERKMSKFGIKNALFGIFDQECLIWVLQAKIFKKSIVMFEISTLKFVYLQNFAKKTKAPKFVLKNP